MVVSSAFVHVCSTADMRLSINYEYVASCRDHALQDECAEEMAGGSPAMLPRESSVTEGRMRVWSCINAAASLGKSAARLIHFRDDVYMLALSVSAAR